MIIEKANIVYFKLAILIIVLLLLSSCAEIVNPQIEPENRPIKSISKWKLNLNTDEKETLINYQEFDFNGNLIINEEYDELGKIKLRSQFEYFINESKEILYFYSDTGISKKSVFIYKYNLSGKVIEKSELDDNGKIINISKYNYDLNGNLIYKIDESIVTGISKKTDFSYSYNNNGNLVEKYIINDGQTKSRDSIIYIPNLNQLKIYHFDEIGSIIYYSIYTYNKFGNVINEVRYFSNNSILMKIIYDYQYFN